MDHPEDLWPWGCPGPSQADKSQGGLEDKRDREKKCAEGDSCRAGQVPQYLHPLALGSGCHPGPEGTGFFSTPPWSQGPTTCVATQSSHGPCPGLTALCLPARNLENVLDPASCSCTPARSGMGHRAPYLVLVGLPPPGQAPRA